jgi:UDP-N-acetylglucosamine--N-acetylmuramyl-(pentapeptide) pyrophosphoryl-undecaprenol N-acetylglucosamine transferase
VTADKTPGVIIAGGGTAGHTLPAIAIAEALVARGRSAEEVHFVGSRRGSEARLVPEAGFAITLLPGRGIQRRLTLANVGAVVGLALAFVQAVVLVRRRRPAIVVAMGGYASLACVLAAVLWRVPLVVAEQNAVAGAANRVAARFAKACSVAFPDTGLPRAVLTGNPVRSEIAAIDKRRDAPGARASLDVESDRPLVLVFGGSLGARRINDAVLTLAERWSASPKVTFRHVIGERDWERPRPAALAAPDSGYTAVRYEADMPTALAAADLVVSRAGATTVAEVAVVGVASVLVPLPIATADHQTANARALVEGGAARLVPDGELDGDRLEVEVTALIEEPDLLASMATAARSLGRPDAADRVATLVEEHAHD